MAEATARFLSMAVNLPNLAAGTHRVLLHTFDAATVTMQVTLQ